MESCTRPDSIELLQLRLPAHHIMRHTNGMLLLVYMQVALALAGYGFTALLAYMQYAADDSAALETWMSGR